MSTRLRSKTAIVLLLCILANAAGNTLLSRGMKQVGDPGITIQGVSALVAKALSNPIVLLGIGLLILFYIFFLALLSWSDLSFVLPIVSFSYVVNAFSAKYFLGESIPLLRWAGIILVSIGVYFVADSGRK